MKNRLLHLWWIAIALLAQSAQPRTIEPLPIERAQDAALNAPRGFVLGLVVDAVAGKPIESATVTLNTYRITVGSVTMGTASPDGTFRFTRLPPGAYYAAARADIAASDPLDEVFVTDLIRVRRPSRWPMARRRFSACGSRVLRRA